MVLPALLACSRKPAAAFRTEDVTRGPVSEIVNATGDVSAIISVNVGSQDSGIIEKLYVDFNSKVKKGDLLATLDPRLFKAAVEHAQANYASALANVEKAQAAYDDSVRIARRDEELRKSNLIAQADLDTAVATRDGNKAALAAAKAAVLQAKADGATAEANLEFTKIRSPIDGIVVTRSVDVGQTVAAAFQAPTLFLIANDLTKMQILANIDEADVGKVHENSQARFTVDAYPGETFTGTIRQVRQSPNTIQNVVTYPAVIDAPNPDGKLRQGMTASVTIVAAHKDDVLRVPNAGLRWRPDNAPAAGPDVPAAGTGGGQRPSRPEGQAAAAHDGHGRPDAHAAGGTDGQGAGGTDGQAAGKAARVYKLVDGKPVQALIRTGISDGQRTEVMSGLAEGDKVIVGADGAAGAAAGGAARRRGPFP
ncbi:MAG TPA: efflux RND transporter periplasmic adaptor subunit [Myxococcales bacterium]